MKKILLSIFWIITLWLINFSSAWLVRSSDFVVSYFQEFSLPYNWVNSSFLCINPNYTYNNSSFYTYSSIQIRDENWNFLYQFDWDSWWVFSLIWDLCYFIQDSSIQYALSFSRPYSVPENITLYQYYFEDTPSTPLCSSWSCTVSSYQDIVYSWTKTITQNSTTNIIDFWSSPNKTMCITLEWTMGNQNYVKLWFNNNATSVASDSQEYWYDQVWKTVCLYANKRYFNINNPKSTNPEISYSIYFLNDLLNESVPCEEVQWEQCTQLKCETDYNLIPESSINSEYCEDRFNLIDPENCPSSWWTGDINWSSVFVNSRQIEGAENIYMFLPDFLTWDFTYIDSWTTLEIDVENEWDEDYIDNILAINTYRPSSEEFAVSFVWGLTLIMPYIIVTLFILFVWKIIKRVFK